MKGKPETGRKMEDLDIGLRGMAIWLSPLGEEQ